MKKEIGITLIALVITIIVLIILAGVSIATLTGDNGLLTKAGDAKSEYQLSELVEKIKLNEAQAQLNGSNQDVADYQSISNKIEADKNCIKLVNGKLQYNSANFTDTEQRILKNDFQLGNLKDTTKPYGVIEKEKIDGKIKLKLYAGDDETDVEKIILPNQTEKKIVYDTEKILFRYNNSIEGFTQKVIDEYINHLKKYFKNITIDPDLSDVSKIGDKNIILDLNLVWSIKDPIFLNNCFNAGKHIVTSGNDTNSMADIIKDNLSGQDEGVMHHIVDNEITREIPAITTSDSRARIHYNDGVEIWSEETSNGQTYHNIGLMTGSKGNYWLDIHNDSNRGKAFRKAIFRLLGTRGAEYVVDKNGTYTFSIVDLSGNIEKISVEVNEL